MTDDRNFDMLRTVSASSCCIFLCVITEEEADSMEAIESHVFAVPGLTHLRLTASP